MLGIFACIQAIILCHRSQRLWAWESCRLSHDKSFVHTLRMICTAASYVIIKRCKNIGKTKLNTSVCIECV